MPGRGEPTVAPPGSAAKIAVMALRASRREPLFHPLDAVEGVRPVRKSLPRGVSWDCKRQKYRARIWDGKRKKAVHLGMFATAEEAVVAVLAARARET